MNYHVVSTPDALGAVFTNEIEAKAYQDDHPESVYSLFDHWPDQMPFNSPVVPVVPDLSGSITVCTDGSCLGNPGPGGYGAVIVDADGTTHELAQGYTHTTNQRMELMGIIAALEILPKDRSVTIASDSTYAITGINQGWAKGWRANGWKNASRKPAKNTDLWKRLLDLMDSFDDLRFEWVKGHAGDTLNEKADSLAVEAACGEDRIVDQGYRTGVSAR
jgi:ribonuclease HI